jgi:flagellar motor switch protein FliM
MADDQTLSALRKKLGAKQPVPEMVAISPASALRKACVRAAQNMGGLVAAVTGLVEKRAGVQMIIDDLPDPALLLLLGGAEATYGLAVADAQAVAALVEHQTTGRVVPDEAEARTPTRTDAVMVAELIDRIILLFETNLAPMDDPPPVFGYRYATSLENPRAVAMALEDMPYRIYRLKLDFGIGAKSGYVSLIFPWFSASAEQLDAKQSKEWTQTLKSSVCETHVQVEAVLHRQKMSFAQITALEVGSTVLIPGAALAMVTVQGSDGQGVGRAKLGQMSGYRAVRVLPPEPHMREVNSGPFMGATPPGLAMGAQSTLDADAVLTGEVAQS